MSIDLSTNKLRDDIQRMEEKFDVGSYINKSEASKFLSELPGIKDLISAIENIVGEITAFIDKLLSMLEAILSWLDLNKIFDALGISELLNYIFDLVNNGLFGFGLPTDLRNRLLNLFKDACIELNGGNYNRDAVETFALSSLLIALACSGFDNTFSSTLNLYKNTPDLVNLREERDSLIKERDLIRDVPEYQYNEEVNRYEPVIDNTKVIPYDDRIKILNTTIIEKEQKIDLLFANTIPKIFVMSSAKPTTEVSITNTINDIASTSAGRLYGRNNIGLSNTIVAIYDVYGSEVENNIEFRTGTKEPIIKRDKLFINKKPKVSSMSISDFNKLESSILVLDKSFDNKIYYKSSFFKGMKRKSISNKEVVKLEAGDNIEELKYCV